LAATVDVSAATGASVVAVATVPGPSDVAVRPVPDASVVVGRLGVDRTASLGVVDGRAAAAVVVLPSPPAFRATIPKDRRQARRHHEDPDQQAPLVAGRAFRRHLLSSFLPPLGQPTDADRRDLVDRRCELVVAMRRMTAQPRPERVSPA
jgi:hypothetical protein